MCRDIPFLRSWIRAVAAPGVGSILALQSPRISPRDRECTVFGLSDVAATRQLPVSVEKWQIQWSRQHLRLYNDSLRCRTHFPAALPHVNYYLESPALNLRWIDLYLHITTGA